MLARKVLLTLAATAVIFHLFVIATLCHCEDPRDSSNVDRVNYEYELIRPIDSVVYVQFNLAGRGQKLASCWEYLAKF
jgi:hypothetical protein